MFLGNWFSIGTAYNNTLWTMQYIFNGSILCVLVYSVWENFRKKYVVLLTVGLIFIIMRMPYFVACILGYALAYYYKNNLKKQISMFLGMALLVAAIILCGFPMVIDSRFLLYRFLPGQYVEYYHIAGAFFLVCICLFCNPIKRVAETKFFLTLGKYSMSIYIIHYAVLISITSYLYTKVINRFSYNIAVLIVWMITIFITYIVAMLVKPVIDKIYDILDKAFVFVTKM